MKLGDREYKNHLDGYNQMDLLTGKGPSKRHELFYFAGPKLGAVRLDDMKFQFFQQPTGWPGPEGHDRHAHAGEHPPGSVRAIPDDRRRNRVDRCVWLRQRFLAREFWRFVLVQQAVAELAMTAIDYPPMQDPASFNLDAVKKQIDEMIKGPRRAVTRTTSPAGGLKSPSAAFIVWWSFLTATGNSATFH